MSRLVLGSKKEILRVASAALVTWGPMAICEALATHFRRHEQITSLALDAQEASGLALPERLQGLLPYLPKATCLVLPWSLHYSLPARIEPIRQFCRQHRPSRLSPLRCLLLIEATEVPEALRQAATNYQGDAAIALQVLAWPSETARTLFHRYPLHSSAHISSGATLQVLIVGFGPLGQALALQVMRLGHYGLQRTKITVWEKDKQHQAAFLAAQPKAGEIVDLAFPDTELAIAQPTSIYICPALASSAQQAVAAMQTYCAQHGWNSPLYFPHHGETTAKLADWDGQSIGFSFWEGISLRTIVATQWERMAQTIHEFYCDNTRSQGRRPEDSPAGNPWRHLEETYKVASRHQADHMEIKLATIECRSLPQDRAEFFAFSQSEEEYLAIIEHRRWAADRYLAGWTFAAERDNALRHHPNLIPYEELSKALKDLDRYAVRLVPALFARDQRTIGRNLRLGVIAEYTPVVGRACLRTLHRQLLRLLRRFPQHCLVLESCLRTPCERSLAHLAQKDFSAALRVHFHTHLAEFLASLGSAKTDFLGLLAAAERRITHKNQAAFEADVVAHVDVLLLIGPAQHPALLAQQEKRANNQAPEVFALPRRFASQRWIHIDPEQGTCQWNFEY